MNGSSLVTKFVPAFWDGSANSNYTKGKIGNLGIVIHHAASTSLASVGQVFQNPGRGGSAQYGVGGSEIHQYVSENDTAYHCSNWYGNQRTIGIETINSVAGGNWPVSEETFNTLVRLVADIAKRNNLGKLSWNGSLDMPVLSQHNDWQGAATYCCGDYLRSRLNELCDKANAINFPPAITWSTRLFDLSMVAKVDIPIVDLTSETVKGTIARGARVDNLVEQCLFKGKTYVRTQYSKEKGFNNGLDLSLLAPLTQDKPVEPPAIEPENPVEPPVVILDPKPEEPLVPSTPDEEQGDAHEYFEKETSNGHGLTPEEFEQLWKIAQEKKEEFMNEQDNITWKPSVSDATKKIVYFVGDSLLGLGALTPQLIAIWGAIQMGDMVALSTAISGSLMTAGLFILTMFGIYKSGAKKVVDPNDTQS